MLPTLLVAMALIPADGSGAAPAEKAPEPVVIPAPLLPPAPPPPPPPAPVAPPPALPDRWQLMKELQGTYPAALLDDHRLAVYGWVEGSYNVSSAGTSNLPMGWNDLANVFMLQQTWVRCERTVVTSGTTQPTFGFRLDLFYGTDYRYTLPRGLWNSQLAAADGVHQNNYGVDLIESYAEAYFPTVFQGLDVKAGRFYTPWGMESNEAISAPFWSRSYGSTDAPFTNLGLLATATINPKWTIQAGIVNGNDVWLDASGEARFLGSIQYTQPGGRNTVKFATSVGRGKFNAGSPNPEATFANANEPAGRNNYNDFDIVYVHTFSPVFSYSLEAIYGYEYAVPANVPGGLIKQNAVSGTAHWGSVVQYLVYTLSPRLTAQVRFELFEDFEGQRSGFEGLYTTVTTGLVFRLRKDVIFKPELRYDYNGYSRPFEGSHGLFTAGSDVILRW